MHLTVLSDMGTQVFFIIGDFTRHDGFWDQSIINSTLRWEEIKQLYPLEHNVYSQQLGDLLKWEAMSSCATSFLHQHDFSFDLSNMLVGTCQINHGTTR